MAGLSNDVIGVLAANFLIYFLVLSSARSYAKECLKKGRNKKSLKKLLNQMPILDRIMLSSYPNYCKFENKRIDKNMRYVIVINDINVIYLIISFFLIIIQFAVPFLARINAILCVAIVYIVDFPFCFFSLFHSVRADPGGKKWKL